MKKEYFLPLVEIETFIVEDVLTASDPDNFVDWSEFGEGGNVL